MKCAECIFFLKQVDLSNVANTQGICRRYPPKAIPVPAQGGIGVMSVRPNVEAKDFCGEFAGINEE